MCAVALVVMQHIESKMCRTIRSRLKIGFRLATLLQFLSLISVGVLNAQNNAQPFLYYLVGHGLGLAIFIVYIAIFIDKFKIYSGKHGEEAAYLVTYGDKSAEYHVAKGAVDGAKGARIGMAFGSMVCILISLAYGIPYWGILSTLISALSGFIFSFLCAAWLTNIHYLNHKE